MTQKDKCSIPARPFHALRPCPRCLTRPNSGTFRPGASAVSYIPDATIQEILVAANNLLLDDDA